MVLFASATVEYVTKSFPTNEIEKIEGRPLYITLKPLMKDLKKCAKAIPSEQAKDHCNLVVIDVEFFTRHDHK